MAASYIRSMRRAGAVGEKEGICGINVDPDSLKLALVLRLGKAIGGVEVRFSAERPCANEVCWTESIY
jgi:hypothetical protein